MLFIRQRRQLGVRRRRWPLVALVVAVASTVTLTAAVPLTPDTLDAFVHYIELTEARLESEVKSVDTFFWLDAQTPTRRAELVRRLARGGTVVQSRETLDGGKSIDVPDGLIQHWFGVVFMPGMTIQQVLAALQDYAQYPQMFKDVQSARILAHDGNDFKVAVRAVRKEIITVAFDMDTEVHFTALDPTHVSSRSVTTRIDEIMGEGTPDERSRSEGENRGFLWRLNNYGRFIERDGGTYMQFESISLSRPLPTGLGWATPLLRQFVKENIVDYLKSTRSALIHDRVPSGKQDPSR